MLTKKFGRRWINPFILKLDQHQDIIISPNTESKAENIKNSIVEIAHKYEKTILELCSGSGTHLLTLAQRHPAYLVIGIELRFKRIVRTAEKAKNLGLNNILLLQLRAEMIDQLFPQEFLDLVHINFPDPWDSKKRWDDRFLLSDSYLQKILRILKISGYFCFKTDHEIRFNQVLSIIKSENSGFSLSEESQDLHSSNYNLQNIFTEFERLFSNQKKPVFYLKAQKSGILTS